jgi:glyoxylase-like metal-dependent hydrolase (beta-lactamase superfamily II)
MADREIEELTPGIWRWERHPKGVPSGEFGGRTSYAVTTDSELLLLDPLVVAEDDPVLDALDGLVRRQVRILVTMPYHARSSERLWRRYRRMKARIYGHPAVSSRLGDVSGFRAVTAGKDVAGVARFHAIGRPPRSEQPIEIPAVRALVFGDAVVETGHGQLRVWDAPLETEERRSWWRTRYLPTLQRLADLDIEHVLVTHGQPAICDGLAALQNALNSTPWQRPKTARPARRLPSSS